jgi:hypothetical protein
LIKLAKQKGFIMDGKTLPSWERMLQAGDPEMRADLLEMTGKPLVKFDRKLKSMRLSNGAAPKLAFLYIPWRYLNVPEEPYELFWKDLCRENGFAFLDLTQSFNALKTGFYPTEEMCCSQHYTASGGHELVALILRHMLVDEKLIPFERAEKK